MNRLVIIGNGFDIAHGLKTSYMDFINWYWSYKVKDLHGINGKLSEDPLCKIELVNGDSWVESLRKDTIFSKEEWWPSIYKDRKKYEQGYRIVPTPFFESILQSIETRGWVDIENDYYQLLKRSTENPNCGYTVKELNDQLAFLQDKLIEYLRTISKNRHIKNLHNAMIEFFDPADFSTEGKKKALENMGLENTNLEEIQNNFEEQKKLRPERIMLLSFNYTSTAKMYGNFNLEFNYIHGELLHPENIIFGYGDELDRHYQDILDRNDNELLKNVKSVKYLETRHYHDMLEFLMSAPFQVLIMGHSCGNSDRTLLNTVFEHENCVSIKPFYHKWEGGGDNYLELVQNISRNFTNMKLFRDRVVNKEQCKTM